MLMPAIALVGYFVYVSIIWNLVVSVSDWKGLRPSYNFSGFGEYLDLMDDTKFRTSLTNNIMLILLFVPMSLVLGLFMAILLDQHLKYEGFFRTIFLLPFTLSFVVTAYLWRWMYNPKQGVINMLLRNSGLGFLAQDWVTNPDLVMYSIVFALLWQFSGYVMLIFLAGIRSIPETQINAAKLDGASGFYLYRRVIIPQIKSSSFTAFVILMVFALKAFDFIFILTGGGPGYSSEILSLTMYEEAFAITNFTTGSAIATIMFFLVMLIVLPYLHITYRRKN